MLRVLLIILLLITPFLVFAVCVWFLRGRRGGAGPWLWVLAAGVACALVGLAFIRANTGHPPGTKLAPPELVDGVVVPSHPIE